MSRNSLLCVGAWLVAIVLFFRVGSALYKATAASRWASTSAVITESDARWVKVSRPVGRSMLSYQLHLRYIYSIGGRKFVGTRASFGPWGDNENMNPLNPLLASSLPIGGRVPVWYDPNDPSRSVIDPHVRPSVWVALLIAMLLARAGYRFSLLVQEEKNRPS